MVIRFFFFAFMVLAAIHMPFTAYAQLAGDDAYENEDLVLAVYADREVISPAIFAIQKNGRFYLPVLELSNALSFYTEFNRAEKLITGWAIEEDRSFEIDGENNTLEYRGEAYPLPKDSLIIDTVSGDDFYMLLEVFNEIWPLEFNVNLSGLILNIDADESLPFMEFLNRKNRQKIFLANKELEKEDDNTFYPFVSTPYKAIGKPSFDIQTSAGFEFTQQRAIANVSLSGVQDLAYSSADYSVNASYLDGEFIEPRNIRLRFSRQRNHQGALPLDLQEVQYGDVSVTNSDLISNNIRGRGVSFTNTKVENSREFDTITIDGIGTPGYEVELYINNQLIDFSIVDQSGIYQFNDVPITYGNNQIRTVLYGPQGQIEENVESYLLSSNMVEPGQYRYSAGIIDKDEFLIPIDERPTATPRGLAGSAYGAFGFSKSLTGFSTLTAIPDNSESGASEETRKYFSAGFVRPFKNTFLQAEAFYELGGGQAIDVRTASDFKGFRVSTNVALYNDFNSPDAGVGDFAKESEIDIDVTKNFATPLGVVGLNGGFERIKRNNGTSVMSFDTRQSLGIKSTRITNQNRFLYVDDNFLDSTGNINSNTSFRKFRLRNALNYRLYPDLNIDSYAGSVRFGNTRDFSTAVNLSYNFNTDDTLTSLQVSKDFEKFLGSAELSHASIGGFGFLLRASTSIGPYANDNSYMMSSDSLRNAAPVSALVFRDNNYDGIFNEGDEPEPDARIKVARRVPLDETDEQGMVTTISGGSKGRLTNVSIEEGSIADPYLVRGEPQGYSVYPRPGVKQFVALPLVDTGAIDGTLRWANDGRPIGGLALELMDNNGDIIEDTVTAQDGYYTFERIKPGTFTIRANPDSGFNIPFEYVTLTPDDLFKFGTDIEVVDLDRPMMVDLDIGLDKDGSLNAKNILSIAKGFKSNGKGITMPVQPRAKIQKAVQKAQINKAEKFNSVLKNEAKQDIVPVKSVPTMAPQAIKTSILDKIAAKINQPNTPVDIMAVEIKQSGNTSKLILDTNAPIEYSISHDYANNMVFVEFPYAKWNSQTQWQGVQGQLLEGYSVENVGSTGIRLNLSLFDNVQIGGNGLTNAENGGNESLYIHFIQK